MNCSYCGREVSGGTGIAGVFYCPMCASIINNNNRPNLIYPPAQQPCPRCGYPHENKDAGFPPGFIPVNIPTTTDNKASSTTRLGSGYGKGGSTFK